MKEVWKDVEGFDGSVRVSNLGRFYIADRFISFNDTSNGSVDVKTNSGRRCLRFHVEVFKAFVITDGSYRKYLIHFLDGDKSNCTSSNLSARPRSGKNNRKVKDFKLPNNEVFKVIDVFGCDLAVSESARVFNLTTGTEYKKSINKGYQTIHLRSGEVNKTLKVHRLVALAWIQNPKCLPVVNHIDGNKLNNQRTNLEWSSYKDNTLHAIDSGLFKPVPPKKLTLSKEVLLRISNEFDQSKPHKSCKDLSNVLGLSMSTIYRYGRIIDL